jgi:hypothetical protein
VKVLNALGAFNESGRLEPGAHVASLGLASGLKAMDQFREATGLPEPTLVMDDDAAALGEPSLDTVSLRS